MSSPRNVELIKRAKSIGYHIEAIFVLTASDKINVERVRNRVNNGGHDVPTDKIISRYHKSLRNLSELLKVSDVMWVIDNSTAKAELLIHLKDNVLTIHETTLWSKERIQQLIDGTIE